MTRVMPMLVVFVSVAFFWRPVVVAGVTGVLLLSWLLSTSRSLVLDESGFRLVPLVPRLPSLIPRSLIAWASVDRFVVYAPWSGRFPRRSFVRYVQSDTLRWRGITPVYATSDSTQALTAEQLCDLLNNRLARYR